MNGKETRPVTGEPRGQSLRERVRQQILDLIGRMDFEYSTRLLSENQLAAKLQVSRSTIRAVLSELETEGKVIRRHGSGTYVNPQALGVETTLYPHVNMYDLVCKNGYTPSMEVLSYCSMAAGSRAAKLNLLQNDPVTEVHSVYRANGRICMYCIDCVDAGRLSGLNWKDYEQYAASIYDYIRCASGVEIAWDIMEIKGAHSGERPELQERFEVPEGEVKPLVRLEITNFDTQNQPVLFGNIYVDTDQIKLTLARDLTKL